MKTSHSLAPGEIIAAVLVVTTVVVLSTKLISFGGLPQEIPAAGELDSRVTPCAAKLIEQRTSQGASATQADLQNAEIHCQQTRGR